MDIKDDFSSARNLRRRWETVAVSNKDCGPSPRSLHAAAVVKDDLFIFGGFDGSTRTNDLYRYNFLTSKWFRELPKDPKGVPSPRDRHTLASYRESLYLFGGFVATKRVNEFYKYNTVTKHWSQLLQIEESNFYASHEAKQKPQGLSEQKEDQHIVYTSGSIPSARHSHAMTKGLSSIWIFGGFDGSYRNDLYEFKPNVLSWTRIMAKGSVPRSRYRTSLSHAGGSLYVFGGHDGHKHLNDLHVFNIRHGAWSKVEGIGTPSARDSHVSIMHDGSMYVFGGSSSGCANNDFLEFCLTQKTWTPVFHTGMVPRSRFCHIGVVHESAVYIQGGYDGSRRLHDFHVFRFGYHRRQFPIPSSTLANDMAEYVGRSLGSDVEFIVENDTIPAHSLFCARCPYFRVVLGNNCDLRSFDGFHEDDDFGIITGTNPYIIKDVTCRVFMALLTYLYSDCLYSEGKNLNPKDKVNLCRLSQLYQMPRLKLMCLREIMESINTENVAIFLRLADETKLLKIKDLCLNFIAENFNLVSTSKGFEELGRENVDLLFEILRRRNDMHEGFDDTNGHYMSTCWKSAISTSSVWPSARSLHAAAAYKNDLFVYGGYDGHRRLNDFYKYSFTTKEWLNVESEGQRPSPRDRHTLTVVDKCLYLFGGFYDSFMLCELFQYDIASNTWFLLSNNDEATRHEIDGGPPTPRHSHSAVAYKKSLYIFGGYDGEYRNDVHEFETTKKLWKRVTCHGTPPRCRYRTTCIVHNNNLIIYAGHDGKRHLNDVCILNLDLKVWSTVEIHEIQPPKRDSHISVVKGNFMYVFGGSSGTALNDFWALDLKRFSWSEVPTEGMVPSPRFCHIGEMHNSSLYIFGGYNGCKRMDEFNYVDLNREARVERIPSSTLAQELELSINNPHFSDVKFLVHGETIYAHRIVCYRCQFFQAMLHRSKMIESTQTEVKLEDIKAESFLDLLYYLYTDEFRGKPMEIFPLADRFGIERLKLICESRLYALIDTSNCSTILLLANTQNSAKLREKALTFLLENFDVVSKSKDFEKMGKADIDLLLEILKLR